jgi:hypothetical protein
LPDYPTQENEHNALDDARWNRALFDFLTSHSEVGVQTVAVAQNAK